MKIKFCKTAFFLIIFFAPNNFVLAKNFSHLSQKQVVESAVRNYPQILSYYEKVNAAQGSALAALGFFDIRLKQNYYDKSRGFYDGKTSDLLLEKEIGFLSGKVYGGFRKSLGSFAEYEGQMLTNSGGEYRSGAKFSLLKNSTIDENRLEVILANLGLQESKVQLETIKKEIERDASKAYWKWIATAKIFQIYEDLYQLSLTRQKQLEEKLQKGDVAQIIVTENKKNVLRRKNALIKARQDLENSAIYLSLFWRDSEGKPLIAEPHQVSEINFSLQEISAAKAKNDIELALVNRPEIRILKIKRDENLNQLKYSDNLLKPQLDIDFGVSKDLGNGPISRSQGNNYAGLEFSIPLQRREAKGKVINYESKLSSLKYEQQLIEEKIKAEIEQIKIQITSVVEMHHNIAEEAKLAELLENSEREKFKHGASNFFLVNLREQDTAAAKAAVIEICEKYQNAIADYKMMVFMP
ncbi:MAG: hypothetical protein EBS06_02110 [Proteobacteria bacterium]|nr:hypothetical protein [Pseudomonadota bacterium]